MSGVKPKRTTFLFTYPMTVNPATRHQAFCVKSDLKFREGVTEHRRIGASVFIHKIIYTIQVQSDLFHKQFIRTIRPEPTPQRSFLFINPDNPPVMNTNIDADFTGFKASVVGVTLPADAQEINQLNTTIFPLRCTLTQPDIGTVIGAASPSTSIAYTRSSAESGLSQYVSQSHQQAQDCVYRLMVFSSNTPPITTATTAAQYFTFGPTINVIDPTFTPYNAYNPLGSILDQEYWSMNVIYDTTDKLGRCLQNVHELVYEPSTPHEIYFGRSFDTPLRGGIYVMLLSDVNMGYSNELDLPSDQYLVPARINSRWILTVNAEVFYSD